MSSPASIKELNRKSYLVYHSDGIIDILVGLTLLGFGCWLLFNNVLFTYVSWLSFGFYRYLKAKVTIPRIGYVRFKEDKKQLFAFVVFGIILLFLLLFTRFYLIETDLSDLFVSSFLRKNHVYIMGSIGALIMVLFGLLRGLHRFAVYGSMLLLTLISFFLVNLPGRNAFFIFAAVVAGYGIILLFTFISRNPIQPDEETNVVD